MPDEPTPVVDHNNLIADLEKVVVDLETKFNDILSKGKTVEADLVAAKNYIVSLEAKLITPENEKKLLDFLSRLKNLLGLS